MAYPSVYPTSLDSYTAKTDSVDNVMAVDVNELQSAIVAIETKLATTTGDTVLGARAVVGAAALSSVGYILELQHSRPGAGTGIYHANTGAYAVANSVSLTQAAYTDSTLRSLLAIASSFDVVADATRNSTVIISTAAAGTFAATITINGRKVTFAGKVNVTLTNYANNAAALAGGLVAGDLYRNNADPDLVCVVH